MKAVFIAALLCLVVLPEVFWGVDAGEYIKRRLSLVFSIGYKFSPVEFKKNTFVTCI